MSSRKHSAGVGRSTGLAPGYIRKQISPGARGSRAIRDDRDLSSLLEDQIFDFANFMHSMLAQQALYVGSG